MCRLPLMCRLPFGCAPQVRSNRRLRLARSFRATAAAAACGVGLRAAAGRRRLPFLLAQLGSTLRRGRRARPGTL
eukprot:2312983-Prymnesium_polylepis.1